MRNSRVFARQEALCKFDCASKWALALLKYDIAELHDLPSATKFAGKVTFAGLYEQEVSRFDCVFAAPLQSGASADYASHSPRGLTFNQFDNMHWLLAIFAAVMSANWVIHDLIGPPRHVRVSPRTDMPTQSRHFRCRGMNRLCQEMARGGSSRGAIFLVRAALWATYNCPTIYLCP